MKVDMILKQFKLNILILLWSDSYGIRENNCCFTGIVQKHIGIHVDVYELIWFKRGIVIGNMKSK